MEAIERYSGVFRGDEIRVTRRFTDFPSGDAILPNKVLLFSDAQYRRSRGATTASNDSKMPPPFDRSAEIEWSPVWSLRDQRFKYLPTSLLYFFYRGPAAYLADSNGCAAGNTLEEAIVQGFLELVERDAYAIWWYNRLQRRGSGPRHVRRFLHPRSEKPVCRNRAPALGARRHQRSWDSKFCGGHALDGQTAGKISSSVPVRISIRASRLLRALTELNQFLSIGLLGGRQSTEIEPRRRSSAALAGSSVFDANA